MKKYIVILITFILLSTSIIAAGDLTIELGETQFLARTGFGQQILLPYTITNIGDEPITSRLGVRSFGPDGEGQGYPLYVFSGEIQIQKLGESAPTKYEGVPITRADGTTYFGQTVHRDIYQNGVAVSNAPTITLQPQESIVFDEENLMTVFSLTESKEYTIGFGVDFANEVDEEDETNNEAFTTFDVNVDTFVKGPNDRFGLEENQYWFYFNEYGDCLTLDTPEPTEFCLVKEGSFITKLMVNDVPVSLYHFFETIAIKKKIDNLELLVGDGFFLTYS